MNDPVLDLLNKQNISFNISGKDFLIKCLNPEHEDSNPSFRVDRVTGIAHCFSCGFKTNIFKFFGITNNFISIKVAKLKDKLKDLHVHTNGVEFPYEKIPYSRIFRGISAKTLKEFGAFYTLGNEKYQDRIIFPIMDIRNKPVAYIGRLTMSEGNPRYLIYPSGAQLGLYPTHFGSKFRSIILVEGIFDLLNCFDKGLPNVVCTFGANTLQKDTSDKLLQYRALGIQKVYIMYDGDDPGRDAAKKLKPLIEEAGFIVDIIQLEDDTDPGDLSQEYIDSIKEYIS